MATEQDDHKSQSLRESNQTASEVIERIGFGWSQIKAASVGGGLLLADGAELLLISSVTQAVAKEWDLSPFERGSIVAVVFFGVFVGNASSGPLGDNLGRRRVLLASFMLIFTFSILSSISPGYLWLCFFRLCVGIGIGVGQPAWNSMGSEIAPTHMRAAMMAACLVFFSLGEVYSSLLIMADDPSMHNLHWRRLLQLGAIPSFVFFLWSVICLHESPIYLAHTGQTDEAKAVLEAMRHENGAHEVSVSISAKTRPQRTMSGTWNVSTQISSVFGGQMVLTTSVVMFSCFVLNLNYYGCMYAFPLLLPNMISGNIAPELLIGSLWELPGLFLGLVFGVIMPRKRAMKVYLGLSLLALIAFPVGAVQSKTWWSELFLYFGYYGVKCFVHIGFVIVYQYVAEVYPTDIRITGTAVNMAFGRAAATLAPLVFEVVSALSSFRVFFFGIATFCFVNAVLVDLLRFETLGVQLKDSLEY